MTSLLPSSLLRHLLTTFFFLSLLFFPLSYADAICCKCFAPDDAKTTLCIQQTKDKDCTAFAPKSANPYVQKITCTGSLSDATECQSIGGKFPSAQCQKPPTTDDAYNPIKGKANEDKETIPMEKPELGIPIPGITFGDGMSKGGYTYIPMFAQYISGIYRYLIQIALVAAAIAFTWGAFLYLFGASIQSTSSGKNYMLNSLMGLFLVLGAYTILSTINPETTSFQALRLTSIRPEIWSGDEEGTLPESLQGKPSSDGSFALPEAVCSLTPGSAKPFCKDLCNGPLPKPDLPSSKTIPSKSELTAIPKAVGLKGGGLLRKTAVEALVAAGKKADGWENGPYVIQIDDSYRPLAGQVQIACQAYAANEDKKVGDTIATPGGSNHGSGVAIDIQLLKGVTELTSCCKVALQTKLTTEANAKLLQDIMASVGWVRYCKEVWHFEFGMDGAPNRSKNCAWPPK